MNSLKTIATRIALAAGIAALATTAAFALDGNRMILKLSETVNVGGSTLAPGEYHVSETTLTGGTPLFLFRSDSGDTVAAVATRSASAAPDQKSEAVITDVAGAHRLDKLFIEGDTVGYPFADE